MSKKQRIIDVLTADPWACTAEVAVRTGATERHVERIRAECGMRKPKVRDEILEIHREQPWLNVSQVAALAGTKPKYAYDVIRVAAK